MESGTHVSGGWFWGNFIAEDIAGETVLKIYVMTRIADEAKFCFISVQLQLVYGTLIPLYTLSHIA